MIYVVIQQNEILHEVKTSCEQCFTVSMERQNMKSISINLPMERVRQLRIKSCRANLTPKNLLLKIQENRRKNRTTQKF